MGTVEQSLAVQSEGGDEMKTLVTERSLDMFRNSE
ncbi:MAG: hypothetical protein JWM68_1123 [Verrucomicrobiales bacterium]|nr:hypothetical protein [Verrucomicrobiales bacterium]